MFSKICRLPCDDTFRHVQVDGVQRHSVHGGRYVDDDVYLAVERRVSGPQERYYPQVIRFRNHSRRQPDVRSAVVVLQPLVVETADLVQYRLGGPEALAIILPARAWVKEKEQTQRA